MAFLSIVNTFCIKDYNYLNEDSTEMAEFSEGISVIVPFYNESEGIIEYCKTMDEFASKAFFSIELVFVDDGSTDNTVEVLRSFLFNSIKNAKIVRLSKNFGMHAAIRAGLKLSHYDICTWMGCDLQEPLEFITEAVERINLGFDAVYVDKRTIGISRMNRFFSKVYSYMMKKFAVSNYSDGGISVIVFNSKIKEYLNSNVESNSSIMLQIIDTGYRFCTISLDFKERAFGQSKWSLRKKIKLFIDSFVSFSFMPIRLVSIIGIIMFAIGIVDGTAIVVRKIAGVSAPLGYPTIASLLVMGFGITNISLGIIAEYLWRTYDAARKRPTFIISDEIVIK